MWMRLARSLLALMSSPSPPSLHAALSHGQLSFARGQADGVTPLPVIGNLAGDLDSLVSAVGLSYFCASKQPKVLFTPVLPFKRDEFRLRQDAVMLFRYCGFEFDEIGAVAHLTALDEAGTAADAWRRGGASVGVALVDHNRIAPGTAELLGDTVVMIVDHHADESAHVESTTCETPAGATGLDAVKRVRLIDGAAGSCCSLVANLCAEQLHEAPPELLVMLLAVIAVDTRGFDAKVG